MNFGAVLEKYMDLFDCSINDICKETDLSYSLVHRYVNGKRTPKQDSEYIVKIIDGLYAISQKKKQSLSKQEIHDTIMTALQSTHEEIDFDLFVDNFNLLQNELSISTTEIARVIGYDPSFISRMKNKERRPADFEMVTDKLRKYIYATYKNTAKEDCIVQLVDCSMEDADAFYNAFSLWLYTKRVKDQTNEILSFLTTIDTFDLNNYISTDFSKIKTPTVPVLFKNSKTLFGIEGRKQAEAEFLKTTLLSNSNEPIFFYSDLPITQVGEDKEFKNKWIYAMSVLLKRGLHLNMVHNLDRPLNEMLLGLENWIPIYMSGSISPYYFKNPPSNFFNGSQCTSGSIALTSECINYNEKKSKFYLTTKKDEVEFEKENMTPTVINVRKEEFKNIHFSILKNEWVIIDKETKPEIHFVIYHEKMTSALETFLLG